MKKQFSFCAPGVFTLPAKWQTVLLIHLFCHMLHAQAESNQATTPALHPFSHLAGNIRQCYSGTNLLYPLGAIGLTYGLVKLNLDARMLELTSRMDHDAATVFGFPGIVAGYLAPVAVPVLLFSLSDGAHNDLRRASYVAMQAVCIASAGNLLLKAITGRKPPDPDATDKKQLSRQFRFGFMRGGMHYGWPSGHLMTNTALATGLTTFYPKKKWLKWLSAGYMAYITCSVLVDERGDVHWLSEVLAGGLMGFVIGRNVGKGFKQRLCAPTPGHSLNHNRRIELVPFIPGIRQFGFALAIKI